MGYASRSGCTIEPGCGVLRTQQAVRPRESGDDRLAAQEVVRRPGVELAVYTYTYRVKDIQKTHTHTHSGLDEEMLWVQ